MNNRILPCLFVLLLSAVVNGAYADECDDPRSSVQIAECLGRDLRDADAKINSSYKELMGKLKESDKVNLRQTQRNWIKDRDAVCHLDSKESNRERWYQALLRDYAKTVCVTRYTRQRTSELETMLVNLSSPQNANPPQKSPAPPAVAYDKKPLTPHSSGKWYFEFAVNYGEVVKIEPCVLSVGVIDAKQGFSTGILDNIRPRHANKDAVRYGFAVDLDNGKLYISTNGAWESGEPGSNLGFDLKLGRDYFGQFDVSADSMDPYLKRKALVPNFGDSAMIYAVPTGYRPWRNKAVN
jgi:uncharacterized protein YecT (DUF1311 family)